MKKGNKKEISGLTDKQKLFCKEYLVDLNGKQAAIRAGYSVKTANEQASRLLTNVNVQVYLKEMVNGKMKDVDDLSQKIINELNKIAFADIKDFMKFDKDGVEFKNSEDVDGTILNEVSSQTIESDKGNLRTNLKIKLHDKMKALEMLGKYKALFTEKIDVTITDLSQIAKDFDKVLGA